MSFLFFFENKIPKNIDKFDLVDQPMHTFSTEYVLKCTSCDEVNHGFLFSELNSVYETDASW